jgi:hypothetical protein
MRQVPPRRPKPILASSLYEPSGNVNTLTVTGGYEPGFIWVFVNGIKIIEGSNRDFTANDGISIDFAGTLTSTDIVEVVEFWDNDQAVDYRAEFQN